MNKIKFLTAGESHGQGLLGIIEGIPAGLQINEEYINFHLARRQKGFGRGGRMKIEKDQALLYTGVRSSVTIGSPIGIIIKNLDWENWADKMDVQKVDSKINKITLPRPGHADLAGAMKYDFNDIRNVIERSSARETAMRVALSSVCRKLLEDLDIYLCSRVIQILNVKDDSIFNLDLGYEKTNNLIDSSEVRCQDKNISKKMV